MFEIVSVMVILFLGRVSFSGRLRFFREGFRFYWRGGDAFGSVLDFFGRGWDYSVVLSLFRGFERFLGGGGDIFRVINFYFHVCYFYIKMTIF